MKVRLYYGAHGRTYTEDIEVDDDVDGQALGDAAERGFWRWLDGGFYWEILDGPEAGEKGS